MGEKITLKNFAIGVKVVDTTVDAVKFGYVPTKENLMKVRQDGLHVVSMISGLNVFTGLAHTVSMCDTYRKDGTFEALKQSGLSAMFLSVPYAIKFVGIPHLGTAYILGVTAYTIYGTINKLRELSSEDMGAKSSEAYDALAHNGVTSLIEEEVILARSVLYSTSIFTISKTTLVGYGISVLYAIKEGGEAFLKAAVCSGFFVVSHVWNYNEKHPIFGKLWA